MADNRARIARIQCHTSVRKLLIHTVLRRTRVRLSHGSFCHQLSYCWTKGQTLTAVGTRITPCVRHCLLLLKGRVKYTPAINYWLILELTHWKCKKPHWGIYTLESLQDKNTICLSQTYRLAIFINTRNFHYNHSAPHDRRLIASILHAICTIPIRAYIKRFNRRVL